MGLNSLRDPQLMARQRVLVQGADNFVGRRVCAALAASDWAAPLPIRSDDAAALAAALETVSAVARCVVGGAADIESGVAEFYRAVSNAAAKPRVVHVSSMTVYGSAVGTVREDGGLRADLGPYSRAQRDAERIALRYENIVILRPGGEYGADCTHWSLHIARLLCAGRLGDLGVNGNGICNLLYIDDLVEAIVRALRLPGIGGGIFNLGVPRPPTWNEYFAEFSRALGAPPARRIPPWRLGFESRLLAPLLKAADVAGRAARLSAPGLPPAITPAMRALWRQAIRLDVSRAEQDLGMRWTDRRQGLERAAAWCRESLGIRS